jgi:hypothetical protein
MYHNLTQQYTHSDSINKITICGGNMHLYAQPNIVERSRNHFAAETQQCILCVVVVVVVVVVAVELRVTVNYIKILSVAQKCVYVKFLSLETIQIICTSV